MRAMMSRLGGTLLAALLAAPALAGSPSVPPPAPADADASRPDPLCASFGKGFTRLAGSSTCVKISGNVQMDGYGQSAAGAGMPGALQPALRSQ